MKFKVPLPFRDSVEVVSSPNMTTGQVMVGLQDDSLGSILETAIQKSPLIYIEKGCATPYYRRYRHYTLLSRR